MAEKVFRTERHGDTLVVIPYGDGLGFRYGDVQTESNAIRRLLVQGEVKNLVIDLECLTYFGSEVIGVFIQMAREATNRGGKAAMCSASDKMRQVLENMRLFNLWPHYDSRGEALDALPGGGV